VTERPSAARSTLHAARLLALATALGGCTLVLENDYLFPDTGGADAPSLDAAGRDAPGPDAPRDGGADAARDAAADAGGCERDEDCTTTVPGTVGRCEAGRCLAECAAMRDDCDGVPENGCEIELATDPQHCGACDTTCEASQATGRCEDAACVYTCTPGFADCDGAGPDCETQLGTASACGGCGDACEATELCDTTGEVAACTATCSAPAQICGSSCVDVTSSLSHCGACGQSCGGANAIWACEVGGCVPIACNDGYADCNSVDVDGCEVDLRSLTHCGACGDVCAPPRATATCASGSCGIAACDDGYADCNGMPIDGCEVDLRSLTHCGACGDVCAPPRATATCASGTCGIAACDDGYADCNGMPIDGCEVDLRSLTHCGACGDVCELARASETCASETCRIAACDDGYADCNRVDADGCEVSLASDAAHCGACGRTCGGDATCVDGLCDPVRGVAPGATHTCAVRESGTVVCWGANEAGQLGDGTVSDRGAPAAIAGTRRFSSLASGASFTCGIEASLGTLFCWGRAGYGELGAGTRSNSATPLAVVARSSDAATFASRRFAELVALTSGACARDTTGEVWCWGRNVYGEVGDGSVTIADAAVRVPGGTGALGLTAGANHVCIRRATDARCWGLNNFGQLGDGTTMNRTSPTSVEGLGASLALSASSNATCAIEAAGGQVTCWGRNAAGDLGLGALSTATTPTRNGATASVLSCGGERCLALTSSGWLGWGGRLNGELGDGAEGSPLTTPTPMPLPIAMRVTMGPTHTCGIEAGRLRCWGADTYGQLGIRNLTLRTASPVADLGVVFSGVSAVAAGGFSTWIVRGGRLFGAGLNNTGILTRGNLLASAIPVEVTGLGSPVRGVAAGRNFACALSGPDGARQVHCWGSANGIATSSAPALRSFTGGEPIELAAGPDHVCAVVDEGSGRRVPYCWGSNGSGQLGRGTTSGPDATPTAVGGLVDVVELELGASFSCARRAGGSVLCWGANGTGQLGDGTSTTRTSPTPVSGLLDAIDLGVGTSHACAVRSSGSVVCWGTGSDGQLGHGSTANSTTPVGVTVLGGALATGVACGGRHTCALTGGVPQCWGSNAEGQLGTGTRTPGSGAVTVAGITTASAIVGARNTFSDANHGCVLTSDSTAVCWGLGTAGRLGSGEDLTISTPSPVLLTY
jgi:alpha-tubulin suppressor-like RCC1 family protein